MLLRWENKIAYLQPKKKNAEKVIDCGIQEAPF